MARKSKAQIEQEREHLETQIRGVLTSMCNGLSLREACDEIKIPRTTFTDNALKSDQYARAYDTAKGFCADCGFDDLKDIAKKVLAGELDPQAGRVAADIIKWRIARMRPNVYGDKLNIEHSGGLNMTSADCEDKARTAAQNRLKELQAQNAK